MTLHVFFAASFETTLDLFLLVLLISFLFVLHLQFAISALGFVSTSIHSFNIVVLNYSFNFTKWVLKGFL